MRRIYAALLMATLIALLGCGIDNTMYNAKKYFELAKARPLSANGRPAPQAVSDYTKAIKKCGIILSDGGKGKRADDALFLMARALFYKGNSAFQAKDAFEGLIRGYPNSKHVPEAYIYLGKVLRDINRVSESEAALESFVRNPKYIKDHPRALLVMADFEIQDEDYYRAQYWLERIIKEYPKTPEAKEAAFLFGKNYYVQGDYEHSLQEFETFIRTRGIPKPKKMEAKYYIGLSHLEMGQHDKALKEARNLVRNEERPEMLARARVLFGRALLAAGEVENGLQELKEVTTSYPRTESAAAAYFYWGNYLYHHQGKIDEAMPQLNRVRTEYAQSPLAEQGTLMASAINKTKPAANLNSSRDLQAWLDYHYLRAENFTSPLAMPDSALATYQRVINERDSLAIKQDSLLIKIASARTVIDSLIAILPDSTEIARQDSLDLLANMADVDSLQNDLDLLLPTEPAELDNQPAPPDSSDTREIDIPDQTGEISPPLEHPEEVIEEESPPDESIAKPDQAEEISPLPDPAEEALAEETKADESIETTKPEPDNPLELSPPSDQPEAPLDEEELPEDENIETEKPEPVKSDSAWLQELQRDLPTWEQKVEGLQLQLDRFDTQIIPFCYFSMNSLLLKLPDRSEEADAIYQKLLDDYPRNMYSAAATAIKEGHKPRLVDPAYNEALASFDAALDSYPEAPDSLVALMQDFTESEYKDLKLKANYRLGWHYSFEDPDTTLAKEYLGYVLDDPDNAEYAPMVRRFFNGDIFLLRDSGLIDSTAVKADSMATSLGETEPAAESPADSLFTGPKVQEETRADSLSFEIDLPQEELPQLTAPAVPDSLQDIPVAPEIPTEQEGIGQETQPEEAAPEAEAVLQEDAIESDAELEEAAIDPESAPSETEEDTQPPQDPPPPELPQDPIE